jgi:hypothetical protein
MKINTMVVETVLVSWALPDRVFAEEHRRIPTLALHPLPEA